MKLKNLVLLMILIGNLFTLISNAFELSALTKVNNLIKSKNFHLDPSNCSGELKKFSLIYRQWIPSEKDITYISENPNQILSSFFDVRKKIHSELKNIPHSCISQTKSLFRDIRSVEDTIGVLGFRDAQLNAADLKFSEQAVPIIDSDKYHPYHIPGTQFEFKKGDIMITKGISMISSTISALPIEPSLFSHIAFVYQDFATKQWGTIESYIGQGVNFFSMKEALLNENVRILILRPKDQKLAKTAHDYIFSRVKNTQQNLQKISYDYQQNFDDNSKLSCEEIAYDAYNTASSGSFTIPWNKSEVNLRDKRFMTSAGLKQGQNMLPADMEVDPRFDIVLDWTDYRLIRDSWRKDAIMREIVSWINNKNYMMYNTFMASLGKLLWGTREIDLLWPMSSKLMGLPIDFETEVPGDGIALMTNLKALGNYLLPMLAIKDQNFYKLNHRWMTFSELRAEVEILRSKDEENFLLQKKNYFHYFFRDPRIQINYLNR